MTKAYVHAQNVAEKHFRYWFAVTLKDELEFNFFKVG